MELRIASRQSELAMVQSRYIQSILGGQIVGVTSEGDTNLHQPLYTISTIGVFVKQLQVQLLKGTAQIAVHSLKDMPTKTPQELTIAAVPKFNVPRGDIAVLRQPLSSLQDLDDEAVIGTSSLRRISVLTHKFRHKRFQYRDIRGNINTRLRKLQQGLYDCLILAAAGIHRVGWQDRLNLIYLDQKEFLYAPAQAALAVECLSANQELVRRVSEIQDYQTRKVVDAQRKFMADLEGGCKLPIGVCSEVREGRLRLIGQVWHPRDEVSVRGEVQGRLEDAQELGVELSEMLKKQGAVDIVRSISY